MAKKSNEEQFMEEGADKTRELSKALAMTLIDEIKTLNCGPEGSNLFHNIIMNAAMDFAAMAAVTSVRGLGFPKKEGKKAAMFAFETMLDQTYESLEDKENGSEKE